MEHGTEGSEGSGSGSNRTFEDDLLGVEGVRRASVHLDLEGDLTVTLLVVPGSDPDHTIAEVHRIAAARGLEVRDPSVEILGAEKNVTSVRRRRFSSLVMKREDDLFHAQVSLRRDGDTLIGESSAPETTSTTLRGELLIVAKAVMDALRIFFGAGAEVEEVHVVEFGGADICLALVAVGPERFVGSALVKRGEHDAAVRATLDAVNRPLVTPWDTDAHASS